MKARLNLPRAWVSGVLALLLTGCADIEPATRVPRPNLDGVEPAVAEAVRAGYQAVIESPDSAEAWGRLGDRYRAQLWLREAAECYAKASELDPENPRWPHLQGKTLRLDDADAAAQAFARALKLDPDYLPTRLFLGQTLVRLGRGDDAREQFKAVLEQDPRSVEAHINLGQVELNTGTAEAAKAHLQQALEIDPTDGRAHLALAQIAAAAGETDAARRHAEVARGALERREIADPRGTLTVAAVGSHGMKDRGRRLLSQGRLTEALPLLREAVETSPDRAAPRVILGVALSAVGRFDEAETHLRHAIWLKPDDAAARAALGKLLVNGDKIDEGLEHLTRAIELDPQDNEARYHLAHGLAVGGKLAEAEALLRQALVIDPDYADAHYRLGRVLGALERPVEAEAELREALDNCRRTVEGLMAAGRPLDAAEQLSLIRTKKVTADTLNSLGTLLVEREKFDEARNFLADALRLQPENIRARVALSTAMIKSGDSESGVDELRRALEMARSIDHVELAEQLEQQLRQLEKL